MPYLAIRGANPGLFSGKFSRKLVQNISNCTTIGIAANSTGDSSARELNDNNNSNGLIWKYREQGNGPQRVSGFGPFDLASAQPPAFGRSEIIRSFNLMFYYQLVLFPVRSGEFESGISIMIHQKNREKCSYE
jgi:hypothetical protein